MPLRDMDRERMWLLPPSLDELLPLDHPARFVAEFVDALDRQGWSELGVEIDGDPMGAPAYHPRALLCVWLYGFMTGVRSCRKLENACRDQIPYLWLTGWQRPDHNTLWRFYKDHRQAMKSLFKRTVRTAVTMKLVDLAIQAVDGTRVAANASDGRTHNAEQLRQILDRVEQAIRDLEAQNESGDDSAAVHLPEKLADKTALRDQVRQAMEELANRERSTKINLTDNDSRVLKDGKGFITGYNAQAMVSPVELDSGMTGIFVTAAEVVDAANDFGQLAPMLERAEETAGIRVGMTLADAGYLTGRDLEQCALRGQRVVMPDEQRKFIQQPYHKDHFSYDEQTDTYYCPRGQPLHFVRNKLRRGAPIRLYRAKKSVCHKCPAFGVCTKVKSYGRGLEIGLHDAVLRRHRVWMETQEAKQLYRLRKQFVEPVFGIIKEQLGARRFLLRGLGNVAAEWTMLATAFNLRTLWKAWRARTLTFAECT